MKKLILIILVLNAFAYSAQIGGNTTFQLLNLPYSARSAALGTDFISVKDGDVNLSVVTPSLLNEKMLKTIGFNTAFFAEGTKYGMANYAFGLKKGFLNTHVRFINYGEQTRRETNGVEAGTFVASEYIVGASYGVELNPRISIGSTVNFLQSSLESYTAWAFAVNLSGTYVDTSRNLMITALVKNAGLPFDNYIKGNKENLPIEFQLGISHKLKHAPFRFSILAHDLNRWNISYNDPKLKPTIDPLSGDTIPVKYDRFGKILANHFTGQVEILIGKSVHLRTAFDYHKRQELKIAARPGLAGFSFGAGIFLKRFSIDYGINIFSRAGALNSISLTTNLGNWKR